MPDRKGSALEQALAVWTRRKWLGIVLFTLLFAAGASVTRFLPDIYRATATVLVERHNVPETFVRSSVTGELETRLQTISEEILSRARLKELITRLDLYPDLRARAPIEAAVEKMRRDIGLELKGVEPMSGRRATVAFNLNYRGRDPETVARVTNVLASFYVEGNVKLREQQAAGTAELLRQQLANMKQRLVEQEERLRGFRSRHVGELPQQLGLSLAALERLHAQLQLNRANYLRALDQRAALAKEAAETGPIVASRDANSDRLAKRQQELRELRVNYGDRYPDVARLKADIASLEREVAEGKSAAAAETPSALPMDPSGRLKAASDRIDSEIDTLKAEEQRLRRDIAAYQQRVESIPVREQQFQELSRDYDMARELYVSLLKRYEDAQLAETMEQRQTGEGFRLLDPALAPKEPVAPNRGRLLLIVLALSLGVAAGAMMLAEHLDGSIHTADDLRALGRAPVLLSIPLIVTASDAQRRRWRLRYAGVGVLLAVGLVIKAAQYVAHGNELLVGLLAKGGS
jgi:polysaccharide chain length determinant protein (PEP-CTERM system associated)